MATPVCGFVIGGVLWLLGLLALVVARGLGPAVSITRARPGLTAMRVPAMFAVLVAVSLALLAVASLGAVAISGAGPLAVLAVLVGLIAATSGLVGSARGLGAA